MTCPDTAAPGNRRWIIPAVLMVSLFVAFIDRLNLAYAMPYMGEYYGWTPEEIRRQQPHLTLAQIYAALSYYHDHRDAFDTEIEAGLRRADQAATEHEVRNSPLRLRLRKLGRL